MNLIISISAAILLTLPLPALQEAQRKSAEPNPRVVAQRTLRMIDLYDLVSSDALLPDFDLPDWAETTPKEASRAQSATPPGTQASKPIEPVDEIGRLAARAVQWQAILKCWIQPPLAEADRLEVLPNGTLLANLTPEAHAWLDGFLAVQRGPQVMLSSRFHILIGPEAAIRHILPAGKDQVFLSEAESDRLLDDARSQAGIELILAPSLTSFFRTRTYVSTFDTIEYVKDWTVKTVEPGQKRIAVPEIGAVHDGIGILVRGVLLDQESIGLEVELQRSVLLRPVRAALVHLDVEGGRDVEIGLPEVDTQRLHSRLMLQPGRCIAFRGPMTDGEREIIVLVHVELVDRLTLQDPLKRR